MHKNFIKIFTFATLFNILYPSSALLCSSENQLSNLVPNQKQRDNIAIIAGNANQFIETATEVVKNATEITTKTIKQFAREKILELAQYCQNQLADESSDSSSDSDSDEELSLNNDGEFEILPKNSGKSSRALQKQMFYATEEDLLGDAWSTDTSTTAEIKLQQAVKDCYDGHIENQKIQKTLFRIFQLTEGSIESGSKTIISLPPEIADQYNPRQKKILIEKISDYINNIEPKNKKQFETAQETAQENLNRRMKIAQEEYQAELRKARAKYEKEIHKQCTRLQQIAYNSAYLNQYAQTTKKNPSCI